MKSEFLWDLFCSGLKNESFNFQKSIFWKFKTKVTGCKKRQRRKTKDKKVYPFKKRKRKMVYPVSETVCRIKKPLPDLRAGFETVYPVSETAVSKYGFAVFQGRSR